MQRWHGLDGIPTDWGHCVVTIGVFDGVHRGHQEIIAMAVDEARRLGVPSVLMTFVPASSDYVNSAVLGSSSTTMIGQVIQAQYLANSDYPTASALSFTLMAVLLIGVFAYARALGTEDVMKVAAR